MLKIDRSIFAKFAYICSIVAVMSFMAVDKALANEQSEMDLVSIDDDIRDFDQVVSTIGLSKTLQDNLIQKFYPDGILPAQIPRSELLFIRDSLISAKKGLEVNIKEGTGAYKMPAILVGVFSGDSADVKENKNKVAQADVFIAEIDAVIPPSSIKNQQLDLGGAPDSNNRIHDASSVVSTQVEDQMSVSDGKLVLVSSLDKPTQESLKAQGVTTPTVTAEELKKALDNELTKERNTYYFKNAADSEKGKEIKRQQLAAKKAIEDAPLQVAAPGAEKVELKVTKAESKVKPEVEPKVTPPVDVPVNKHNSKSTKNNYTHHQNTIHNTVTRMKMMDVSRSNSALDQ